MKKAIFFICACLTAIPALANVSRIIHDNSFSGHVSQEQNRDTVILLNERLEISFPQSTLDYESLDKHATIVASYTIQHKSLDSVEIPLRFIGVDIVNPQVTVNGTTVSTAVTRNVNDEHELLLKLAEHRYLWDKQRYSSFLGHFLPKESGKGGTLQDILAVARTVEDVQTVLGQKFKPGSVSFTALLKPGKNELTVTYSQKLAFDGKTSYMDGPDGWSELNYLLYPAATWTLDKNFLMTIMVNIPDYLEKGWFSNTLYAPEIKTNVEYFTVYNKFLYTTRLGIKYASIPGSILTVLVKKGRKR